MDILYPRKTGFTVHTDYGNLELGDSVDIILRRVIHPNKTQREIHDLRYLIEIMGGVDNPTLAILQVLYPTSDSKICMNVFRDGAFGQGHRLGLKEFSTDTEEGVVLTINGLLWDDGIIHVKDIVA